MDQEYSFEDLRKAGSEVGVDPRRLCFTPPGPGNLRIDRVAEIQPDSVPCEIEIPEFDDVSEFGPPVRGWIWLFVPVAALVAMGIIVWFGTFR